MIIEAPQRLYTVPEFLAMDELWDDDDVIYELVKGKIMGRPKSGISGRHGEITNTIGFYLKAYAAAEPGKPRKGRVFNAGSTTLGRPEGSNYFEPDVCFVAEGRIPDEFEGAIPVAPDLVAEVNSPSDTTERIHNKIKAYLEAGVKVIWSVYMLDKFVLVYEAGNPDIKLYNLRDELDGGAALSGFKLPVSAIFS